MNLPAMSPAEFEQALRAKGEYYHIHHPFHRAMYAGQATREQIQGWVANRFYYQVCIPVKDAAIMANCPDRDTRREWIQRIIDHDGAPGEEGGIEAWLRLAEAVGLDVRVADLSAGIPEDVLAEVGEKGLCGILLQQPGDSGRIHDHAAVIAQAKEAADHVAESNDDDGVAQIVEGLLERL